MRLAIFAWLRHADGAVIERKSPGDLASCIGSNRERFERELKRARYCGRFVVVVEGSLSDVAIAARRVHHSAIIGSIAAWTLRFCPFVFAGSQRLAVDFAVRLLASQLPEAERRRVLLSPASARLNGLASLESPAGAIEEEGQPGALSNADAPPF